MVVVRLVVFLLGLRRSPRVAERNEVNSLASPRILFKTSLLGSGKVLTRGKSTEGRRVNKEYYPRKRRFNGSVLSQWLAGGHVQLPRGLGTVCTFAPRGKEDRVVPRYQCIYNAFGSKSSPN